VNKDLVSFSSLDAGDVAEIFALAAEMKAEFKEDPRARAPMAGMTAALIFEKPSLRTRVSFEVGIFQLGGHPVFLTDSQIGPATREAVEDIAGVLSRYNDLIIARTLRHSSIEALAAAAGVPVINALSDLLHPCQILADAFTMRERGLLPGKPKVAFIGDGNNIVNSWLELAAIIPLNFVLACPRGYEPDPAILARSREAGISDIGVVHDPREAAESADVLYTDVWVSMGQEEERTARLRAFEGFQINASLLRLASRECLVMHCLPAHRGEEITAGALSDHRSVILDQAENRLHLQKAVMAMLLERGPAASPGVRSGAAGPLVEVGRRG
jgi:ornithine carbamoyltransferase